MAGISIGKDLFNGNIKAMAVNIPKLGAAQLYTYNYDQLNRITKMDAFTGLNGTTNVWTPVATDNYKERISYDANGNILTYKRNGNAARLAMDDMSYSYKPGTNQLDKVTDAAPDAAAGEYDKYNDIKKGQATGNYKYDAIGNLISDVSEGITNISWSVYGKIQSITKSNGTSISYTYDASGNRISKTVNNKTTCYVRDASGNVMSIYTKDAAVNNGDLTQSEVHLYGNSRIGIMNAKINVEHIEVNTTGICTFTSGNKFFELSNHLGNVAATASDKHNGIDIDGDGIIDYYVADVITASDYYPGGMLMPGRTYQAGSTFYRFGFNTHEKSDEISGAGNHTTALYGEYDTRLVRRWNPDPKPTVGISDYSLFFNNPIWRNDILLDTPTVKEAALMADDSYKKFKDRDQTELTKLGWNRVDKIKTNLFGKTNQEVSLDDLGAITRYNMALYSRTLNGKTEWVLANAGTADLIDVGSDARNLTGSSDQYAFSVRFAKSLQNGMGGQEMTYVGHSLGGGLAAANSLATGNAAITFNPAGVSWGTRVTNNLPKDKRNGQIQSFVVGGEAVDKSQRWVGSKANGQITYIHPQLGKIDRGTALMLRWSTDIITSVQYHMMETVLKSLDKARIK